MRVGKTVALIIILFLPTTALGAEDSHLEQWSKSDPSYVPYPVYSITVSADNCFIALAVDEKFAKSAIGPSSNERTVYLLDSKTGQHRKLGSGDHWLSPSPSGHTFLYYGVAASRKEKVVLFDGLQVVREFDIGEHSWCQWNPFSHTVLFEAGWPSQGEGFNVVGILDTSNGRVSRGALRQATEELNFCATTGHFYTQHWYPNASYSGAGTDEYDASGRYLRNWRSSLAVYSANCAFVLPEIGGHGPDDWGVYDARSRKRLIDFPWSESKSDLHVYRSWNPRHDDLLLMDSYGADGKTNTLDILDVTKRRVVQRWDQRVGDSPRVWSGDGKSTVTVRDHRIVFEPLAPSVLGSVPSSARR